LKLAATVYAYNKLEKDYKTDEKRINEIKTNFITNQNLHKLGQKLKLNEHLRMDDPDIKNWNPAFSN